MKIIFTCDIDWANENVISYTLNLFKENNIKCTLFATHDSKSIRLCDKNLFEIGIHPNFNESLIYGTGKSAQENVQTLIKLFPEAIGVRSHSITSSGALLEVFKKNGLKYECNQFVPYSKSINPYKCWNGMTIIPYNFEDDVHFTYGESFDFSLLEKFKGSKYLIMDFHPIHIYLNTDKIETYEKSRSYLNSKRLADFKNISQNGTRDLLLRTFKEIKEANLKTYQLKEIIK